MTADEIRAAAERVLAAPPLCRCDKPGCRFHAAVSVARGWVADNPADDADPVTAAWLRSLNPDGTTVFAAEGRYRIVVGVFPDGRLRISGVAITEPATRGAARRLLAALGHG